MGFGLGLLAATLLGIALAASGTAHGEGPQGSQGDTYRTTKTTFGSTKNSEIGKAFRDYAASQGYDSDFLDSLSDKDLGSLLSSSYAENGRNFLGVENTDIIFSDALKELQESEKYRVPNLIDYSQIYEQAEQDIAAENAEVEALYDQLLSQQTANLNQQMADLNQSYQDTTNQILSSDYIKNRQLMDTATSELSRSRRNALEAGASAGLRLANNVNTMLSVQNQQAQQSLQTSNNLAQMMLNQRQAAAGIRGDYYNALTNDTANRAALKQGNAERTASYKATQTGLAQSEYQNRLDNWDATMGNNPWGDHRFTYSRRQDQRNKYYGG